MAASSIEIEADDDSAIGETWDDGTESLKSSLLEGLLDNGHIYHRYGKLRYNFPEDEAEQVRLNIQHHLFLLLLDGELHLAPLQEPKRVLDLGPHSPRYKIIPFVKYPKLDRISLATVA